jgi:Tfp pilus assembly protein PilF
MGGGSREQKDIFLDLYLEIQRRLGNADAVTELAQKRLSSNPNHIQSWGALAWAYGKTGQDALQRQAYRQLVTKGEAVGLAPDNPALLKARQALQVTP